MRSVACDLDNRKLIAAGTDSGTKKLYPVSRDGLPINLPITVTFPVDSIAVEPGGSTAVLLDSAGGKVYRFSLLNGVIQTTIDLTTLTPSAVSAAKAVAFDASTPGDFYVLGTAGGSLQILERNKSTGAAVASWSLPAGLTSPIGMTIDPLTGDFYVFQNAPYASGPDYKIDLYKIQRSSPTTANVSSWNLTKMGSSMTNVGPNYPGLCFDPASNHFFLSDNVTDKIFEVVPDRLINPLGGTG